MVKRTLGYIRQKSYKYMIDKILKLMELIAVTGAAICTWIIVAVAIINKNFHPALIAFVFMGIVLTLLIKNCYKEYKEDL